MNGREYAARLRERASWWERFPELPAPSPSREDVFLSTRKELATVARALLDGGVSVAKGAANGYFWLRVGDEFTGVDFNVPRTTVCTSRVVGAEEIPARPACTREIVEWDCQPILSEGEL